MRSGNCHLLADSRPAVETARSFFWDFNLSAIARSILRGVTITTTAKIRDGQPRIMEVYTILHDTHVTRRKEV